MCVLTETKLIEVAILRHSGNDEGLIEHIRQSEASGQGCKRWLGRYLKRM
jgi:hypothetical protein